MCGVPEFFGQRHRLGKQFVKQTTPPALSCAVIASQRRFSRRAALQKLTITVSACSSGQLGYMELMLRAGTETSARHNRLRGFNSATNPNGVNVLTSDVTPRLQLNVNRQFNVQQRIEDFINTELTVMFT